jgi:SDR family mycofactocin-dependent oxidoreductase
MGALDAKVAFVTGAARGQGRSHALALAAAGADVVALDVPGPMATPGYPLATEADLNETVALIEKTGRKALAVPVDIRVADQVEAAVTQTIDEFGQLDIVVANAGIVTTGPLDAVTDQEWDELVSTNLTGVFHTLRASVREMRAKRFGRIVVTSSMGGRMGIPGLAAYNATKWGVIGMAKSVALEVAKEGITVNVVCPTTVQTPTVQPDPDRDIPDDLVRQMMRSNPIPQPWIQPEDVTRAVMYLVTDPGVITGAVMEIGLGSSARMH